MSQLTTGQALASTMDGSSNGITDIEEYRDRLEKLKTIDTHKEALINVGQEEYLTSKRNELTSR